MDLDEFIPNYCMVYSVIVNDAVLKFLISSCLLLVHEKQLNFAH